MDPLCLFTLIGTDSGNLHKIRAMDLGAYIELAMEDEHISAAATNLRIRSTSVHDCKRLFRTKNTFVAGNGGRRAKAAVLVPTQLRAPCAGLRTLPQCRPSRISQTDEGAASSCYDASGNRYKRARQPKERTLESNYSCTGLFSCSLLPWSSLPRVTLVGTREGAQQSDARETYD